MSNEANDDSPDSSDEGADVNPPAWWQSRNAIVLLVVAVAVTAAAYVGITRGLFVSQPHGEVASTSGSNSDGPSFIVSNPLSSPNIASPDPTPAYSEPVVDRFFDPQAQFPEQRTCDPMPYPGTDNVNLDLDAIAGEFRALQEAPFADHAKTVARGRRIITDYFDKRLDASVRWTLSVRLNDFVFESFLDPSLPEKWNDTSVASDYQQHLLLTANASLQRYIANHQKHVQAVEHTPNFTQFTYLFPEQFYCNTQFSNAWLLYVIGGGHPQMANSIVATGGEARLRMPARSMSKVVSLYEYAQLVGAPAKISIQSGKIADTPFPTTRAGYGSPAYALFKAKVSVDLPALLVTQEKLIPARLVSALSGKECDSDSGFDFVLDEKPTSPVLGAILVPGGYSAEMSLTKAETQAKLYGTQKANRASAFVDFDADGGFNLAFKAIGFEYAEEEQPDAWISGPWFRTAIEVNGDPHWVLETAASTHCEAQ